MKNGQLNISFGAIFSIIIIVATLAVAGYVIYQFIRGNDEVKCGLFYQSLQDKINSAWSSDGETSFVYTNAIPSKTTKVCFGYLNQTLLDEKDKVAYDYFKKTNTIKENLYIYPSSSCGDSRYKFEVKNAVSNGFFCVDNVQDDAHLRISKEIGKKVVVSER